jgi:hypothetical protein
MFYAHSYQGDSLTSRLERLESSVFGEAQTGSESERQNRLIQVLGAARKAVPNAAASSTDPMPENSPPSNGISGFSSPSAQPTANTANIAPPVNRPPDATDYPTITALEREVFSRDFIHEDISHRLSRLEKRVFGQSYPQMALADRVDKLLARYPHVSASATSSDSGAYSIVRSLPDNSSQFAGSSRDVYTKVDELERKFFNAPANTNALLTERLDRLETRAYGRTYSGESIDTRVNRLLMAYRVDTPMGVQPRQAFQSRRLYQPSPGSATQYYAPSRPAQPQSASVPQNIQIGGGFSENSTYHFSPEMMSMLPPGIRNQLGTGQSSTGTVVSAPGTIVMNSTTTGYPVGQTSGFQTYGGAPIQYYNYYGTPTTTTQSQTTTTVIQPNGSTAVYGYPGVNPAPGTINGLPTPAYVGDPAFLQSLNNLEINVYGQVNIVDPVYVRLGKLETTMLGQIYATYPDDQRLANLQRAYQLQSIGKLLGKSKAANFGRTAGSALFGVPLNTPNPVTLPPATDTTTK